MKLSFMERIINCNRKLLSLDSQEVYLKTFNVLWTSLIIFRIHPLWVELLSICVSLKVCLHLGGSFHQSSCITLLLVDVLIPIVGSSGSLAIDTQLHKHKQSHINQSHTQKTTRFYVVWHCAYVYRRGSYIMFFFFVLFPLRVRFTLYIVFKNFLSLQKVPVQITKMPSNPSPIQIRKSTQIWNLIRINLSFLDYLDKPV